MKTRGKGIKIILWRLLVGHKGCNIIGWLMGFIYSVLCFSLVVKIFGPLIFIYSVSGLGLLTLPHFICRCSLNSKSLGNTGQVRAPSFNCKIILQRGRPLSKTILTPLAQLEKTIAFIQWKQTVSKCLIIVYLYFMLTNLIMYAISLINIIFYLTGMTICIVS